MNLRKNNRSVLVLTCLLLAAFAMKGQGSKGPLWFADSLKDWESFWQGKFKTFSLEKFCAMRKVSLKVEEEQPWTGSFTDARSMVTNCFSPDSAFFIDIYTYRWELSVNENKLHLAGGEPESQVELSDVHSKKISVVAECGPSGYYELVRWLGPEKFILAGHVTVDEDKQLYQGFIYLIDLRTQELTLYVSRNYHFIDPTDFIKYHLSQLLGVAVD